MTSTALAAWVQAHVYPLIAGAFAVGAHLPVDRLYAVYRRLAAAPITLYRITHMLAKGAPSMVNVGTLIISSVRVATLGYQVEQIEANPNMDAPTKRAHVVALLPQFVPVVDTVAGLPAGTVEKYLTPDALAAIYDGAVLAETALSKV